MDLTVLITWTEFQRARISRVSVRLLDQPNWEMSKRLARVWRLTGNLRDRVIRREVRLRDRHSDGQPYSRDVRKNLADGGRILMSGRLHMKRGKYVQKAGRPGWLRRFFGPSKTGRCACHRQVVIWPRVHKLHAADQALSTFVGRGNGETHRKRK